MSIKDDCTELIRLKRDQIYEFVIVTLDGDSMVESGIKEVLVEIKGKFSENAALPYVLFSSLKNLN